MADIIHLLPDAVANQIAAGEVIQRPASVVKELVENAVDAGSTSITVNLKDAGKTLVQVVDNGCGMSETDARMSFERHATSKIMNADDLFAIRTKGFRGEALASVAAIAHVELRTKRSGDEVGTEISIIGSKVTRQEPVSCQAGANFLVKNLFFNVPARRKFLKSHNTELRHVIIEFQRIVLAHPEIEFSLIHNESEIYNLPVTNIRQRIVHIFGKHINQNLTTINTETSLVVLKGFIGKPEFAKKTMGEQFFFVNNRFMKHPYFHKAVINAYDQILPPETIPSYFIYMEADPKTIDVNIHPTKTEIKFEDERAIFQIIQAAVKEALGRFNITPSIDFNNEGVVDIPVLKRDTEIQKPEIPINPDFNPFDEEDHYKKSPTFRHRQHSHDTTNWEKLYEGFTDSNDHPDSFNIIQPEKQTGSGSSIVNGGSAFIQLKNKYILTQVKSGLMVINQKRAHERILFERYINSFAKNISVAQQSLYPETINLDPADYTLLLEITDDLHAVGFDIGNLGNNTIVINGCPSDIENPDPKALIEKLLEEYKNTFGDIKTSAKERLARSMAAATSINYGKNLKPEEMNALVDELFACENPNYSPTGKMIIAIINMEELDTKLK